MVDSSGRVVATVFASITGTPRAGGFAVPNALVQRELVKARRSRVLAATGHCAN
jgi:predicted outer membrane lipoprotein